MKRSIKIHFLLLVICNWINSSFAIEAIIARTVLNSQAEKDKFNLNAADSILPKIYLKKRAIQNNGNNNNDNDDPDVSDIQELYLEQPLDHFQSTSSSSSSIPSISTKRSKVTTLQQRYFYTPRYIHPSQSLSTSSNTDTILAFLCVGGEGPSLTKHVLLDSVHCSGDMLELAKQLYEDGYPVYLFALEHRYYGESYPKFLNPVSNQNLTYLSSRQALADLSHFIPKMNQQIILPSLSTTSDTTTTSSDIKWVTFGGSYPGMLSAWARLKFPHLVHASVSNSSPVQAQIDFPEYYNHVSFALSDTKIGGSEECLEIVMGGHAQVASILDTLENPSDDAKQQQEDREKVENVADLFHVCNGVDGLTNPKDRSMFLGDGLISVDVQGNDPSCSEKLCNVEKVCQNLMEKDENLSYMERLAELAREEHPNQQCLSTSWQDWIRFVSSPMGKSGGLRSWLWQTCTEFGFYQTCEVDSHCPFGKGYHVLDQDLELCELAFGVEKDKVELNVQASLDYYGGWDIEGSRIIFTNGDVDPWSELAVTGNRGSESQPAVMAEGASHHFWTHKVKETDAKEVDLARQIIYYQIKEWLGIQEEIVDTE